MALISKRNVGFKILGPFYVMTQLFGLLLVKETDNKVACSRKDGGTEDVVGGGLDAAFSPDKRHLAHCAALVVCFCWTARRCVALVGGWPCDGDATLCSSAVEWTVAAACAAQAATSVAVAAAHRRTRTAELLNAARDVLAASAGCARTSHVAAGAWYAATAATVVAVRSAAVVAARPDRFAAADVLALCVPAAAAAVAVECAIVCVCSVAERAGHDAVDRLRRLAADVAEAAPLGRRVPRGPEARLPVHWRLERVWRDHWRGCRLVDRLSRCHGLDLAVNLTASMLLFVVYAYVTMMSVYGTVVAAAERPVTAAAVHWNLALACQLACVSFRIVSTSYRAERIKQVASNSVLISLRNLLKQKNLDTPTIMLINSFTYQIMNKELKITACGFFSVNLSFFHALIRLATTYLIVIIQYNGTSVH